MYLLIDNYDSFTYNLVHFLGDLGAECEIWRNDKITVDEVLAHKPQGIVISPGPCDPPKAGICVDLIKAAAENAIPLLGVCLGHQSIGYAFGATVERGPVPMHGKVSAIHHQGIGLFEGLKDPLSVTRYHSLVVAEKNLPDCFRITAQTDDGIIMGMEHKTAPLHGVQFHPESIASEEGHALLNNFLKRTRNDGA